MKYLITAVLATALMSCAGLPLPGGGTVTGTPGFYKESVPSDPAARFGVFVEAHRGVEVLPEK